MALVLAPSLIFPAIPNLELVPVLREVLLDAASLRARYRLRTPDAILLATGVHARASAAIANDESWPSLTALEVITLSKLME